MAETETKKVNIELEVDTNVVDSSKNQYQSWIDMARAIEWGIHRDENIATPYLAVNVGSNLWNYKVSDLAKAVSDTVPNCQLSFNVKAPSDKRSYKVNFDLFKNKQSNKINSWKA